MSMNSYTPEQGIIDNGEETAETAAFTDSQQKPEDPLHPQLNNSLEQILKYSEADEELAGEFARTVKAYASLEESIETSDELSAVRRDMTKAFYSIYKKIFLKHLDDPFPPTVVKMFLNFGYVDEDLAGHYNANYMYEIADSYNGCPEKGIYTIHEWLLSIYEGKNDPSLSEFDMDYTAYVRDLKNSKQIDANEEKRMLADLDLKLQYEMENAFVVVSRVTFGRPSKFCPVFDARNIIRDIKTTIVEPDAVLGIIDEIRSIDFSAFYRQTAYSDHKAGVISEHIHVEVLPNFILTPNVGLRGSMWQDVEGRVRTTPARIFLPAFLDNDLKPLIIKLTGEFRWEICRRIQGSRWNDMTDPSLTAYFCDYLQFYMNNRNIAMQTMTEIRNEISAARNNYKTVFVNNYLMWVMYESKGMARLNEISLGIMMTFCPFPAEIRERLKTSMRYNTALNKYSVRQQKRVQHLENLIKKLNQMAKPATQEIKDELAFWNT